MSDAHAAPADAPADDHAAHAAHGPQIPEVVDEAGNSPAWLPWLGIGLLCAAAALFVVLNMPFGKSAEVTTDEATGAEQAGVEEQAEKPAAAKTAADGHEGHGH